MKQIGARLNIGESRVSQIQSLASVRLRARLKFLQASGEPGIRTDTERASARLAEQCDSSEHLPRKCGMAAAAGAGAGGHT